MERRVGTYWYMLPEAEQARKALWNAINPHTAIRRIDEIFPPVLRTTTRDQDMMFRWHNGSTLQVVGSDNFDSLVGAPPIGIVFSEWPLSKPQAWAYMRPILLENGGWAVFNGTPRGKNHAYRMLVGAANDPSWFTQVLTAKETSVFTPEQLESERNELIREHGDAVGIAMFDQEYGCKFEAPVVGSIYGQAMREVESGGRIRNIPHDKSLKVETWWDLGGAGAKGDATSIWYVQYAGNEIRLIDYDESNGKSFDYYAGIIQQKGYVYGRHVMPHDAKAKRLESIGKEKSIIELAKKMLPNGEEGVCVAPMLGLEDGINQTRMILSRCYFDTTKTQRGRDCLTHYKRDYSEKLGETRPHPVHDWASHGSDAFRTGTVAQSTQTKRKKINMNFPMNMSADAWMS
jgi:phage terminase large subunit